MAARLEQMLALQFYRGRDSLAQAAQVARAAREDRVTSVEAPATTAAAQAERPTDTRIETTAPSLPSGRRAGALDLSWVIVPSTIESALQVGSMHRDLPAGSLLA